MVIVAAMRRPREALAWWTSNDAKRLQASLGEGIQLSSSQKVDVSHMSNRRVPVVIVGSHTRRTQINGGCDRETGLLESQIQSTSTTKQTYKLALTLSAMLGAPWHSSAQDNSAIVLQITVQSSVCAAPPRP
jgi:hypothetical protein